MINRFLISAAAVALIGSAGLAHAQGTMGRDAPAATERTAPAENAAPTNRGASPGAVKPGAGVTRTQSEERAMPRDGATHAQDSAPGPASKSMSEGGRDKAGGAMNAEGRRDMQPDSKAGMNADKSDRATTTTGQAGAGAKLNSEQRTRITTVIRDQKVQPAANVDFNIAVGTRVPRTVEVHPLPAEILTIYPAWRGYEFFLVRDEIIVVDPRTMEIVAVLNA